jgi:hypothetical protein
MAKKLTEEQIRILRLIFFSERHPFDIVRGTLGQFMKNKWCYTNVFIEDFRKHLNLTGGLEKYVESLVNQCSVDNDADIKFIVNEDRLSFYLKKIAEIEDDNTVRKLSMIEGENNPSGKFCIEAIKYCEKKYSNYYDKYNTMPDRWRLAIILYKSTYLLNRFSELKEVIIPYLTDTPYNGLPATPRNSETLDRSGFISMSHETTVSIHSAAYKQYDANLEFGLRSLKELFDIVDEEHSLEDESEFWDFSDEFWDFSEKPITYFNRLISQLCRVQSDSCASERSVKTCDQAISSLVDLKVWLANQSNNFFKLFTMICEPVAIPKIPFSCVDARKVKLDKAPESTLSPPFNIAHSLGKFISSIGSRSTEEIKNNREQEETQKLDQLPNNNFSIN